jgi:hypothetical protein
VARDRITQKGLAWIEAQKGERWALYLHVLDVHTPYRVPAPAGVRFVDPAYHGPVGYGWGDIEGAQQGKYDDADKAAVIGRYDSALRYIDDNLGKLFDALRERGILDHTLVVVSADHGEELWDHGSFFHGVSLYDEQLHVRSSSGCRAARAGTVVNTPVRSIDIVPTMADVLGAPVFPSSRARHAAAHHRSGRGRPREASPRGEHDLSAAARGPTPTHKLILTQQPFGEQLFDLTADPHERTNLIDDPAASAVLADLRARLTSYRAPRWKTGFQVRAVAQAGVTADVEVTITSNDDQMLADPDRVGGDRPDTLELAKDGLALTWRGPVGDKPIGIRFDRGMRLRDDTGLTIRVRADGADPARRHHARRRRRIRASPFVYKVTAARLQGRRGAHSSRRRRRRRRRGTSASGSTCGARSMRHRPRSRRRPRTTRRASG